MGSYKNFENEGPGANAYRAVLGLSGRSSCSEGNSDNSRLSALSS